MSEWPELLRPRSERSYAEAARAATNMQERDHLTLQAARLNAGLRR